MRPPLVAMAALAAWSAACSSAPTTQRLQRPGRFKEARHLDVPYSFDTLIGVRMMEDSETWNPVDDQLQIGINVQSPVFRYAHLDPDPHPLELALNWDFAARYSFDRSETVFGGDQVTSIGASIFEVDGGLILNPFQGRGVIEPYVGAGIAFVFTDAELRDGDTVRSDRDTLLTPYVRTGFRAPLGDGRVFGFDVHWLSNADASIDGIGADVGALTASLLFGANFLIS